MLRTATPCSRAACLGVLAGLLVISAPAYADSNGGILGGFLNALQNAVVTASWQPVDEETQNCLQSQYNLNAAALQQQGVLATDQRVAPYIDQCRQLIAQQQQQQAQQEQAAQNDQQQQAVQEQRLASLKSQSKELIAKYGRKQANEIIQGNIDYGMNADEVELAWGDPEERSDNTPAPGKQTWKYGDDLVVFTKGRVSDVKH